MGSHDTLDGNSCTSEHDHVADVGKPNHTTILPNIMAAFIFFIPCALFLILKLYVICGVYSYIIIFLLVSSVSNIKWKEEIKRF